MIDLLTLEPSEAERIAYAEGFTMAAELFARIAELESKVLELENQIEDTLTLEEWETRNGSANDYKEFFFDCFEYLAGHYPAPSVSSEYDKSVIFDAITRSEGSAD